MTVFYTYLYRDPKNDTPIYVGKGKGDRAFVHLKAWQRSRIANLLRKRVREGFTVEPIIYEEPDEASALTAEEFWIAVFGRADLGEGTLLNRTPGGDGMRNPSEETRKKIGAATVGRKCMHGKTHSAETKAKLSALAKGRAPWNKGLQTGIKTPGMTGKTPWNKGRNENNNKRKS